MRHYVIDAYQCVKNPKVSTTLLLDEWFNFIRHSDYSNQITLARNGELEYDRVKLSIPCVTYNFRYNEYKKDENITENTGLIYFDVDDPRFDITSLDKNKVFAYYKSFGGNGYAILAQVGKLEANNFKSTYLSVANDLGITEYIDPNAVKASQFNVLSYDANLFVNYDSKIYLPCAPPSSVKEEEQKAYTLKGGAKKKYSSIRFDNLDEFPCTGEYTVNWDGFKYISCFIPMKLFEKNRNRFLLAFCANLLYLNPTLSKSTVFEILNKVNRIACAKPVDESQITRVVNSIFKQKQRGKLKPTYYRKPRKIIFNDEYKFTKKEKMVICMTEVAKQRAAETRDKFYKILEAWNFNDLGLIRQRKVYKNFPISKKTVEKYWHEFKDYVEELNKEFLHR